MKKYTNFELKRILIQRTFTKYKNTNCSILQLSKLLNLSVKQTRRLLNQFNKNPDSMLNHKNKSKMSYRLKDCFSFINEYKNQTIQINSFRNDESFRMSFSEFYNSNEHIRSFCSLRTLNTKFQQALIYSPVAYRSTKRKINKQIKELANPKVEKEINKMNQYEIFKEVKPYKAKDWAFGEIVELDACQHRWINNNKYFIYHAVDAQTGMILAIHVEKEETTIGYYKLLDKMLSKYGIPSIIKTDRRKTFWGNESTQTLMQESLNALDIELLCDSSPTFKPNVERSFYTAQYFYPKLAYLKKINTIELFSKNIDKFGEEYNVKFNKKPIEKIYFKKVDQEIIDNYICPKQKIKINNGMYISFKNKCFAPINEKGLRVAMKSGYYVNVHIDFKHDELFIIHNKQKLLLKEITPDLIFDGEYENLAIERKKIEEQKRKMILKNKYINNNLEQKQAKIEYKIKYLQRLLNDAKNNGIFIKD